MQKSKIIGLFISLLLLVSCGDDNEPAGVYYYDMEQLTVNNLDDFSSRVAQAFISTDAPRGLALVIKKDKVGVSAKLSTCTSFLISKNQIMTNSHCIPNQIKADKNVDCSKHMAFIIKTDNGITKSRCNKVIQYSKLTHGKTDAPDYAIVEIKNNIDERNIFEISRQGIKSKEATVIHSFDTYYNGSIFGNYRMSKCISYDKSVIGSFFNKRSSIVPLFRNDYYYSSCKIIPGNSGSPVIKNSSRSAIGVVYASQDKTYSKLNNKDIDLSKINRFGVMTNFACQSLKGFNEDRKIACKEFLRKEDELKKEFHDGLLAEASERIKEKVTQKLRMLPQSFRFENISKTDKMTLNLSPLCMVPLDKWPQQETDKIKEEGFIFMKKKTYTAIIPSYRVNFEMEVNEYGVFGTSLKIEDIMDKKLQVDDLEEVSEVEKDLATMTMRMFTLGQDIVLPLKLRLCTQEEIDSN